MKEPLEKDTKYKRGRVLLCLFAFSLSACSTAPDITSTAPEKGKTFSSAEIRQVSVDQPFLLSGDYFREKNYDDSLNLGKLSAHEEEILKKQKEIETRLSKLELEGNKDQQPDKILSTSAPLRLIHTGLLIATKEIPSYLAEEIAKKANTLARQYSLFLVPSSAIKDVIDQTSCAKKNFECISKELRTFPGVRILLVVNKIYLPKDLHGSASAVINIIDTEVPYRYGPREITYPVQSKDDLNGFLQKMVDLMFEESFDRAQLMPWHCRSFSGEGKSWYVNAGRLSGLRVGDRLSVLGKGKWIRAPSGLPAGWIPGSKKGTLEVTSFFGKNLAICTLVQGRGPTHSDILVIERK